MAKKKKLLDANVRRKILAKIKETGGNVTEACRHVAIGTTAFYHFIMHDASETADRFRKQVEEAKLIGVERLEDEARRRALTGVDEPVFYQGDECGIITKYSDTLLIFLIKGHKKMYVDRHEVTGVGGAPLSFVGVQASIDIKKLKKNELEQLQKITKRIAGGSSES